MKRHIILGCAFILMVAAGDCLADGNRYLGDVRFKYDIVLMSRITSADTLLNVSGYRCFYSYDSAVIKTVRGKFQESRLKFTSETGLVVGDEYLIYFSKEDALAGRYAPNVPPGSEADRCRRKIKGFHLLYSEMNHKTKIWDGKQFVDVVEFGDPLAEVPPGHDHGTGMKYVDLSYLIGELSN